MNRRFDKRAILAAIEAQGFAPLRGPQTGRLRCWYNPTTNELCFQDRKDTQPERISLNTVQPPKP